MELQKPHRAQLDVVELIQNSSIEVLLGRVVIECIVDEKIAGLLSKTLVALARQRIQIGAAPLPIDHVEGTRNWLNPD